MRILITITALLFAANTALASSSYIKLVKPIEQRILTNPHNSGNSKRFEGCGPVAAAMMFSHWDENRGYTLMRSQDSFNGTAHPKRTIRDFYKISNTRKAPAKSTWTDGKKYNQSYTLPAGLMKGLKNFAAYANERRGSRKEIAVNRMSNLKTWKKRKARLLKHLNKGNPVILLIKNIPACLNSKNSKSGGWHYVIVIGHNDSKEVFYLLSGWDELTASTTTGPSVHKRISNQESDFGHIKCSYAEIKKSKPGLFYFYRK